MGLERKKGEREPRHMGDKRQKRQKIIAPGWRKKYSCKIGFYGVWQCIILCQKSVVLYFMVGVGMVMWLL